LAVLSSRFIFAGAVRADDKKREKNSPTRELEWTVTSVNNTREQTMKLETKDGKPPVL